MILVGVKPFGQRFQRGIGRRARARNCGVPSVLPVTGIIDEEKRVAVVRIFFENACPIERERPVAAKREPESFRLRRGSRNVKRAIFSVVATV